MAFDKDLYSKTRHTEWNTTGDRWWFNQTSYIEL